jgi:hypothetical protein
VIIEDQEKAMMHHDQMLSLSSQDGPLMPQEQTGTAATGIVDTNIQHTHSQMEDELSDKHMHAKEAAQEPQHAGIPQNRHMRLTTGVLTRPDETTAEHRVVKHFGGVSPDALTRAE